MPQLEIQDVVFILLLGIINAILISFYAKDQFKHTFVAAFRSFAQLLFLGLILQYIFDYDSWWLKVLTVIVMVFNASFTMKGRITAVQEKMRNLFVVLLISILPAIVFSYFLLSSKYFNTPSFFIPFIGMLIGNSLTGLTLGINTIYDEIKRSRRDIIVELSFNLSQTYVAKKYFRHSLKTGLTPIINTMLTVGIVSIPGLMTGQMMAGASPFLSARYQYFLIIAIQTTVISSLILYFSLLKWKMRKNNFFFIEVLDETH